MTAASMDCASSYSERASSPTVGSEKILGNLKAIRRVQQKLVSLVAVTLPQQEKATRRCHATFESNFSQSIFGPKSGQDLANHLINIIKV